MVYSAVILASAVLASSSTSGWIDQSDNTPSSHIHARGQNWYTPPQKFQWQWQIDNTIVPRIAQDVYPNGTQVDILLYDIDIEEPAETIAQVKSWGAKVVCYFEAGTWVSTRPWAKLFPGAAAANGKIVSGAIGYPYEAPYTNELWINPTDPTVLSIFKNTILPFAKAQGCDMVEPDNVQGFERDSYCTGFEATTGSNCNSCTQGSTSNSFYVDQKCDADYNAWLDFNKFLANEAHALGMGIALKNNHLQAPELVNYHDFVLAEQCTSYGSTFKNGTTIGESYFGANTKDCIGYMPFLLAGKAVALTEYSGSIATVCANAAPYLPYGGLNTILKTTSLTASPREACCGSVPCKVGSVGTATAGPKSTTTTTTTVKTTSTTTTTTKKPTSTTTTTTTNKPTTSTTTTTTNKPTTSTTTTTTDKPTTSTTTTTTNKPTTSTTTTTTNKPTTSTTTTTTNKPTTSTTTTTTTKPSTSITPTSTTLTKPTTTTTTTTNIPTTSWTTIAQPTSSTTTTTTKKSSTSTASTKTKQTTTITTTRASIATTTKLSTRTDPAGLCWSPWNPKLDYLVNDKVSYNGHNWIDLDQYNGEGAGNIPGDPNGDGGWIDQGPCV
ncbi:UNVERIFIED_CONTAM: hypothetical protein HDU68_008506 [Siphonaria sp. JEL0065]|nr:hypothetical protein HDU68_008506 [Siphonaria sp. JEL0065]